MILFGYSKLARIVTSLRSTPSIENFCALEVFASRLWDSLKFECKIMEEEAAELLSLCMRKMDYVHHICVDDLRSNQTKQSLFLDVLAKKKLQSLKCLSCLGYFLSGA